MLITGATFLVYIFAQQDYMLHCFKLFLTLQLPLPGALLSLKHLQLLCSYWHEQTERIHHSM